jgi:hypothetical protein
VSLALRPDFADQTKRTNRRVVSLVELSTNSNSQNGLEAQSDREGQNPSWDRAGARIMESRFDEQLCPVWNARFHPKSTVSADSVPYHSAENLVGLKKNGERAEEGIKNRNGCDRGLSEIDNPPVIPNATHNIRCEVVSRCEGQSRFGCERPQMSIAVWNANFTEKPLANAQSVVHDLSTDRKSVTDTVTGSKTDMPSVIESLIERAEDRSKPSPNVSGPSVLGVLSAGRDRASECNHRQKNDQGCNS